MTKVTGMENDAEEGAGPAGALRSRLCGVLAVAAQARSGCGLLVVLQNANLSHMVGVAGALRAELRGLPWFACDFVGEKRRPAGPVVVPWARVSRGPVVFRKGWVVP